MVAVKKIIDSSSDIFDFIDIKLDNTPTYFERYENIRKSVELGHIKDLENFKKDISQAMIHFQNNIDKSDAR